MELKIVYRVLRKISDWTLGGFYSEVHVEGQENVPRAGPLIITSTHHNEIIDIATLAATIPYRRQLSFWAKSTMFVNPITRAILTSTGAIPVRRNPNNGTTSSSSAQPTANPLPQSNLFKESSNALASGQIIGVFPEGTSYTQHSIVQVMPGAAWAAVEFVKWVHEQNLDEKGQELTIVPVGIVYTDKSRYLSRVCIKYGTPITVSAYTSELFNDNTDIDAASKLVVKNIMVEVEKQMKEMSINAPDWDTLYAAETARDILWENDKTLLLKDWVTVSQNLIKLFSTPASPEHSDLDDVKASLVKYRALLHYAQIKPSTLNGLIPQGSRNLRIAYVLLRLPATLLSLIMFTPAMILHLPAYLTGSLAARFLSVKDEEETHAQFKAIGGGVGLGASVVSTLWALRRTGWLFPALTLLNLEGGVLTGVKRILGVLGGIYSSFYFLVKWHTLLVAGVFKRLLAFCRLFAGILPHNVVTENELEAYLRPPPPPPNPFIKNRDEAPKAVMPMPNKIAPRRLIKPMLSARKEASTALGVYLRSLETGDDGGIVGFLKAKGARIPM
ncbi:hypothetical protein BDZ94DRAFT_1177998 [Collybia nuda]|uniref:Phospholipid/glycerol acyltransferase domain-containing protein n=1 Tax=Collybia nuda TaxID=64659 RepID=A0A9P5XTK2_9AGAR|nr:hypothetical protein BDZ94DRAFT_1177998 [Collybia nuda]